ncbi:hypothetical protein ABIA33_000009 [Streptacidiphilus sp. MAP12-16]
MTQSAESTLSAAWRRSFRRLWRSAPKQGHDAGTRRRGPCMVSAMNYGRLTDRSTSSSGSQCQSRGRAGDNPSGGQPVDRRLWDGASRGGTGQPMERALIRKNVTQQHGQACRQNIINRTSDSRSGCACEVSASSAEIRCPWPARSSFSAKSSSARTRVLSRRCAEPSCRSADPQSASAGPRHWSRTWRSNRMASWSTSSSAFATASAGGGRQSGRDRPAGCIRVLV